jgi:NAD(P)H-hydrate epimerase
MNVFLNMGGTVRSATDAKGLSELRRAVAASDFIVDALLGTGVKGPVNALFKKVIEIINRSGCPVFAVDAPSGVSVDDGRVFNCAVNADHTITFGEAKIGLFVWPGSEKAGEVYVADIGIPVSHSRETRSNVYLTQPGYVREHVRERPMGAHKGDCGKLLIVGGSRGMSGAPALAGMAALKIGAGLVYLAVPKSVASNVERKLTEGITISLREDGRGRICAAEAEEVIERAAEVGAVAFGPGLGVSPDTRKLTFKLIESASVPLLLDADALNCVALDPDILKAAAGPVVITPHPGEMARLAKVKTADVQAARLDTARSFAAEHGVTVVLKGAGAIIASPDGSVRINPTGNPGMATAGSGDVLTGMTGALMAEGVEVFPAAACAAYLHGLAGDIAAEKLTRRAVTASDIVRFAPAALSEALSEEC